MITRRQVVAGGALTLIFGGGVACPPCVAQSARLRHTFGCILSDEDSGPFLDSSTDATLYVSGNEPMIPKSGNKDFDFALAHTLAKISTTFGVLPGFAFYDDYDNKNAYATPRVRRNRADGTVLFGERLLRDLMRSLENPDVAVSAVCAHEFGHILQFKHGLDRIVGAHQSTVKRVELQADFFAGFFAGIRKLDRPTFPAAVFAKTQYGMGDPFINDEGHHGTSAERGAAVVRGYKVAYDERKNLSEAIQISINYVSQV